MAAFNHFHDEQVVEKTHTGDTNYTFVTDMPQILGSSLVNNNKYLIIARSMFTGDSNAQIFGIRIQTDDDAGIEAKSEMVIEPLSSTSLLRGNTYPFVHSYITDGTPADIEYQIKTFNSGQIAKADQMSLHLLDLDDISAPNLLGTFHFDASDAGPTDSGANWTSDANAFDGSITTFAQGGGSNGALTGEGTTAPTTGATIGEVTVRLTAAVKSTGQITLDIDEDSVGGTNLLSVKFKSATKATQEFLVTAPAGGWTFQKVNDLACSFTPNGSGANEDVYLLEVKVYDTNGRGYFETVNDDDASQYPTTQAAEWTIPGTDLGTDEHLILAYQRTGDINTGRNFRVEAFAAVDTSTTAVRAKDENEGEDTAELRMSGFALRHQASSGTPNFEMQTWTEFANAFQDRGGFGIALPTSLFVSGGFKAQYTAAGTTIDTTERTFQTITSYSPSVTADHLLFGMYTMTGLGAAGERTKTFIEDDDVEMRVGDEPYEQAVAYDNTAEPQSVIFHQNNILSSDTSTYTLRATLQTNANLAEHRWLIILSLEKAAVAAGAFPPFRRRQLTTVRM